MKSDFMRIDFENPSKFSELKIPFNSCENCKENYLHSKKSALKNLVSEIPSSGPPIIDFT